MSDLERSTSPTLRSRSAGQTVMQKVLELQDNAPPRGRLARALGQSPLHPDAVSWYQGALGELETGRRLATLGAGYTVLHSLPIGGVGGGADGGADGAAAVDADLESPSAVDHLVIGAAGVFCLNSTPSVTDAQRVAVAAEARQVSKHLSRTLQRVVPVTPLLVTAGVTRARLPRAASPSSDGASAATANVEVVPSRALAGWFVKRGPVLTTAELATLAFAAERPDTWRAPASVDQPVLAVDFHQLQSEVNAATDRERAALTIVVIVAVLVALVSASVILSSLLPGFFWH
ncbi:hypothetical protein BH10ACT6_BH10ACT6_10770 [soil metagenome]